VSARRLFFALWPSEAMQSELSVETRDAVADCGGRPIGRESLHLTLAFLGSVPETAVRLLAETARATASCQTSGAVAVTLDAIDYWRKPQLLCAVARDAHAAAALASALRQLLTGAGFSPDLKPFRAHATLARKVARAPKDLSMTPVVWSFTQFALIESRTDPRGSVYSMVDSWTLCGS
jgi:2'-5' RNA ligase